MRVRTRHSITLRQVSDEMRTRWEARTEGPLVVAAVLFLGAYAWPILDPHLPEAARTTCRVFGLTVWAAFAVDFAIRLALAEHRARFVRANLADLVTLAAPMLRPLRALQVVVALNVLARRGGGFVRGRVVVSVVVAVAVVGFVASLAMLDAERGAPDANITSFGDATWWAAVTATTAGYGDHYPTTTAGRLVAVGLMITGIALLGVVTAALASWFVERLSKVEAAEDRTAQQISELTAEVRALRAEVRELRGE
jgi:voltage-gated potassium channel